MASHVLSCMQFCVLRRVDFGKPADGSRHQIGGKGMETKGRVDVAKGSIVEMKGQLKVEGEGR